MKVGTGTLALRKDSLLNHGLMMCDYKFHFLGDVCPSRLPC